jgi:hypothetical protein
MWQFNQTTGEISQDGNSIGFGYSGKMPDGKNNPAMQCVPDIGPIPCGIWDIQPPYNCPTHGPFALPLVADPATQTFGRYGFLIHGDSIANPGYASEGCIIANRLVRVKIWDSNDHRIMVVSGIEGG